MPARNIEFGVVFDLRNLAPQERSFVDVYAETCAQYLVLDDSLFERPDGHLFACCPQIKKKQDQERLWSGLRSGDVSVISTDTCTFSRAQKARWEGDWTKIPMGLPGLETLVPIVYTHGVLAGRLTTATIWRKQRCAQRRWFC